MKEEKGLEEGDKKEWHLKKLKNNLQGKIKNCDLAKKKYDDDVTNQNYF